MIVTADFIEHWKTSMLIQNCDCEGVSCILRLWSFCQTRKTDILPTSQIEHIAKWTGQKGTLLKALFELRFIDKIDDATVRMHDFAAVNNQMFASWGNGKKGGRPKTQRKPSRNPAGTQQEPSGNPAVTQRKPSGNPAGTQQEPSGNPAVTQQEPSGNPAETQRKPSGNPAVTQRKPSGNPENAPSDKKTERTKERKNINISPLYSPLKDGQAQNASQTDSKNKAEIKKLSIMAECLNSFKGNFENSNLNISSSDKINIFNAFEEWLKFRFFTIEKPLKPQTAVFHSKRAVKCLVEDFLSPSQLIELFRKSIENEWQGWYFKENVLKLKAFNENSKFQKNPAPLGVPSGAWESDDDDFVY